MNLLSGCPLLISIQALCLSAAFCQNPSPPALPFYDWKACPFEGCSYGPWKAQKPIDAYDTCKPSRHVVSRIVKGESVAGIRGVVITFRPGMIRLDRDLAEIGLKRGDRILTYAYRGEGYSAVWFKGVYQSEFDISFAKWPDGTGCGNEHCAATYVDLGKKEWWAMVKLKTGRTAWIAMDGVGLDGVDTLGAIRSPSGVKLDAVVNRGE